MRMTTFEELRKALPEKKLREIDERVAKEVLRLNLRAVRELAGKTQAEVAKAMKMAQGEVSRVERRDDHRLSTLRAYVSALGGELEVVARFGDKSVTLHGV